jgi:hypothetical protein
VIIIAHSVICSICRERFDRDKIAFVQTSAKRYAHASCALRLKEENGDTTELIITDPNDFVSCTYCKQQIDKRTDKFIQLTNSKYAHLSCSELEAKREKTDAEKLDDYIMKLFNYDYVPPRAKKQINQFIQEYNYTYSGMLKALVYFYEIKGGDREAAHDGIGIIPFIYQDAYNYYYSLWLANQRNEDKELSAYKPKVIEVRINPPEREIYKRKLFQFLDEEE